MDNLSDDHKARLLKRLEKLQSELHKRLSDDRIKEISEIVWRTQTLAEGLPNNSPYPLLDDKKAT